MAIVGFNIEKIDAIKKKPVKGNIQVKNNISITNLEEKELALGDTKKEGLKFSFKYSVDYDPDIGNITLAGSILYLDEAKKAKELFKNWKKDKKVPKEIMLELVNTILLRCTVKSLNYAQEINLPPHLNLPVASAKADVSKYIG